MSKAGHSIAVAAGVVVLVVGAFSATFFFDGDDSRPAAQVDTGREAALASEGAPTIGDANAKVHIVEFLDPACETCALFYPMVKKWMSEVPGQIRLSVRHVAFHSGSEYPVRALLASRKQDRYWETLEALLAAQRQWTEHHVVKADKVDLVLANVDLDLEQLKADMNSMDVLSRFEQDKNDAITLKVSKTPDYYVNGRPLPSFGAQQLADLVREELEK